MMHSIGQGLVQLYALLVYDPTVMGSNPATTYKRKVENST